MILAEVASVHQILSLLGHKVKVPAAARQRMYQLVRGRDSTRTARPAKVSRLISPSLLPSRSTRGWCRRRLGARPSSGLVPHSLVSVWSRLCGTRQRG